MLNLRGGATLKRSALLSSSSKIAFSLVILAPLVLPLLNIASTTSAYAAPSGLSLNGSNLTIDIVKDADESVSVTGTTTVTTTVSTTNPTGYTLTAAIDTTALQALTKHDIDFSLSGGDASNLSFDEPDQPEQLLVTNTATPPTAGEATDFAVAVTVLSSIAAGVYVIGINYDAISNRASHILYTNDSEEDILDLETFVKQNSNTTNSASVRVNGEAKPADTIKGVYLYGEVPISPNFLRAAFYNCTKLVDVDFELTLNDNNSVSDLSYYFASTFQGCTNLNTSINLPAIPIGMTGVTDLGYYFYRTFQNCQNLNTTIDLPAIPIGMTSVTYLYIYFSYTFSNCSSLNTTINLPAIPIGMTGVTNLASYFQGTFDGCTSLNTTIDLPAIPSGMTSVTELTQYLYRTFYGCSLMTNDLISNIPPCDAGEGTPAAVLLTGNYARNTAASPDTPISNLTQLRTGYDYH